MMHASFSVKICTAIVSYYRPTNTNEETDITFYSKLSTLICLIPKHNIPIIVGDKNVQIGKDGNIKSC